MPFVYITLVLVFVLITILLIKTLRFIPEPLKESTLKNPDFDEKHAIESLKSMLRFKTVSYADTTQENAQAFKDFRAYLKTRYPTIAEQASIKEIKPKGIIFHIKGQASASPVVLMSHYDVVPENGVWQHDPFLGDQIGDSIYGRGALDTKSTLASIMESVTHHLNTKKPLKNDLYLCFSGDEETRGPSAPNIVSHFKKQGIKPGLVLDEGGAIVAGIFPGVTRQAALIGTAEKGYLNLELTAKSSGGHASMPPNKMPITELSKAALKLHQKNPFKIKKVPSTMMMFDRVVRHSESFMMRFIFANLWLFFPVLNLFAKVSPEIQSILKTTQAFTMAKGADAMNVLPTESSFGINYRIITGETSESVHQTIQNHLRKHPVESTMHQHADPTTTSRVDGSYHDLETAIRSTWDNVIITPYLMMAGTDSRYYHDICNHVYRFSAMTMTKADRGKIHSVDEDITIDNYLTCIRFYINLLEQINT